MKASGNKRTARPESAVFPQALHRLRPAPKAAPAGSNAPVRDKVFSQSRDTRENRGERQMKTSHSPQTIPHAH